MFKRYHNKRVAVGQNTDRNKVKKDKALKKSFVLALIMCFISIGLHIFIAIVRKI